MCYTGRCSDYSCTNRTAEGYCKTTVCIKPTYSNHLDYIYSTCKDSPNFVPNQTEINLNKIKGAENWKINIGDKVLDIHISEQKKKPIDTQSVIDWTDWYTEKPEYDDEFLVCVMDDTGDTPYTYVTCAYYLSVHDIWICDNEILSGIYAWSKLPKPIKYKR